MEANRLGGAPTARRKRFSSASWPRPSARASSATRTSPGASSMACSAAATTGSGGPGFRRSSRNSSRAASRAASSRADAIRARVRDTSGAGASSASGTVTPKSASRAPSKSCAAAPERSLATTTPLPAAVRILRAVPRNPVTAASGVRRSAPRSMSQDAPRYRKATMNPGSGRSVLVASPSASTTTKARTSGAARSPGA